MNDKLKGNNTVNHNIDLLYQFNLSDKNSLKIFNKSTRDITNLNVLKCIRSGVIVLEKFVIPEEYYEKNIHYTDEFKGNTETVKGKAPVIILSGIDKQLIGQIAAKIKGLRPVEPYKGKGIKFVGEWIRRKVGKAVAATTS